MYETILVPTDGSEGTNEAVRNALDIAAAYDATVHALSVVDISYPYSGFSGTINRDRAIDELESRGRRAVDEIVEQAEEAGVDAVPVVRKSKTVREAILEYADETDADVIVMGTHGRTGLGRYMLGSVTEFVVRSANVPVLTVRMLPSE